MKSHPLFLPMSLEEAETLGIEEFDIIIVTGDAYVDHPSFGAAVIGRVLWDAGYTVGIIAQPGWKTDADFKKLGRPRLFFGVTSGNVDSMVNNYTASLKVRSDDVYSRDGKGGLRPNRAAIVYSDKLHSIFRDTPIVLGGIEASLRRFAHYDYWSDSVRQSILADAPADIVVFGMGERQVIDIARRLQKGEEIENITDIPGTVVKMEIERWRSIGHEGYVEIPGFAEVSKDKGLYARAFKLHYQEQDPVRGRPVAQPHPKTMIIQNKPALPLSTQELDRIYELPFTRMQHPSYEKPIPALAPVKFSIISHRGCFASCSFCALTHHQGRIVQSRSIDSIVREVVRMTRMPGFKGIVQDVGGPTANMYSLFCRRWDTHGACTDKICMFCESLEKSHEKQVELLRRLREIPGVKKVFIGSGIRYDLVLDDSSDYISELCAHHISGQLKVAPEHVTRHITDIMHKPSFEVFEEFKRRFDALNKDLGKKQYILPYFMSGHPGSTLKDMIELAEYIRDNNLYTEQVQDFTPTPMTASTCMYYTGIDPFTMEKVHVPKGREKRIQRALMQYKDRKNYGLVIEGLKIAGRTDLIGSEWKCLIRR
ncbi:MAG: YgiQ family radical SAM protein [Candidatus Methanoperedens sp.]|nr:YgiQ family radical SAM protein [Candidatus Methanoperedens sp.]MCZ7370142.1 YgiQ family radical SAM protein [Candidatus Methanoperedens sp.]